MTTHHPIWDPSFGDAPVPPGEITVEGPLVVGPGGDVTAIRPTIQLTGTGAPAIPTAAPQGEPLHPHAMPGGGIGDYPPGMHPILDAPSVPTATTSAEPLHPHALPEGGTGYYPPSLHPILDAPTVPMTPGGRPYQGGAGVVFSGVSPLFAVAGMVIQEPPGEERTPEQLAQDIRDAEGLLAHVKRDLYLKNQEAEYLQAQLDALFAEIATVRQQLRIATAATIATLPLGGAFLGGPVALGLWARLRYLTGRAVDLVDEISNLRTEALLLEMEIAAKESSIQSMKKK